MDKLGRYGWVTQQQQQQPSCRTNSGCTQVRPLMLTMMLPSLGDDEVIPARMATYPIRRTTATTASSSSSLISSNGPSMVQQQELPSASSYRSSHYVREWMQTQTTQSSSQSMTQLLLADAAVVSPSFASPLQTTTPTRSPPTPPTKQEVALLQQAFATFYGSVPNPQDALPLLNQVVEVWEQQPADERAGLYRVRGDCHMALLQPEQAMQDYSTAISLLLRGGAWWWWGDGRSR